MLIAQGVVTSTGVGEYDCGVGRAWLGLAGLT